MKRGFTMIELIFVIVILGILAAVAIPRLAATRDDAEVSKSLTNLSTVISDLGSYYTSKGQFGNLTDMTNVATFATTAVDASTGTQTLNFQVKQGSNNVTCVNIATNVNGTITITDANGAGTVCQGVVKSSVFSSLNGTKHFGGSNVVY